MVLPDLRRRLRVGLCHLPPRQLTDRPSLDGDARGRAGRIGHGYRPGPDQAARVCPGRVVLGFAGSLWASMLQFIDPFQFNFSISIVVLAMIILGGIGNIWGVIFGGVVLGFYDRVLTSEATNWLHGFAGATNIPVVSDLLKTVDLSQYKFGIFGVALVVLMLTRPEGIFPNRQRAVEFHSIESPDEVDQLGEEGSRRAPRWAGSEPDGRPARRRASTKRFGGLIAVNSVDFSIAEQAIVSLIGPNGAGKTTFFNILAGLYTPTSGRITFDGQSITGRKPHTITSWASPGPFRTFGCSRR